MSTNPIKGYRDLTNEEIVLINQIKALADLVGDKVEEVFVREDTDTRWAAIAKTDLQRGFMCLIRSVAKPESF